MLLSWGSDRIGLCYSRQPARGNIPKEVQLSCSSSAWFSHTSNVVRGEILATSSRFQRFQTIVVRWAVDTTGLTGCLSHWGRSCCRCLCGCVLLAGEDIGRKKIIGYRDDLCFHCLSHHGGHTTYIMERGWGGSVRRHANIHRTDYPPRACMGQEGRIKIGLHLKGH